MKNFQNVPSTGNSIYKLSYKFWFSTKVYSAEMELDMYAQNSGIPVHTN